MTNSNEPERIGSRIKRFLYDHRSQILGGAIIIAGVGITAFAIHRASQSYYASVDLRYLGDDDFMIMWDHNTIDATIYNIRDNGFKIDEEGLTLLQNVIDNAEIIENFH